MTCLFGISTTLFASLGILQDEGKNSKRPKEVREASTQALDFMIGDPENVELLGMLADQMELTGWARKEADADHMDLAV